MTLILWPLEFHTGRGPIYHEPYGVDREPIKEKIKKYEEKSEGPWITMLDRAGLDIFKDRLEQYTAFVGPRPGGGGCELMKFARRVFLDSLQQVTLLAAV